MTAAPHSGPETSRPAEETTSRAFPIVFTDLDGTLLDHDTYSFDPARNALRRLERRRIPLVINSSKTPAEITRLRHTLRNTHPFIAENGSVVAVPDRYFPEEDLLNLGFGKDRDFWHYCPGGGREEILDVLTRLREDKGFSFTGFADMDDRQLARMTGLTEDQADLAKNRLSTEPIVWQGSPGQWETFAAALQARGLAWVQGGRFISVSRPFDKKDGVELLLRLYREAGHSSPVTIGLGDSPNDQAMLTAMDIAVIIRSNRSEAVQVQGPGTVIRTRQKGPRGWQEAMDRIFASEPALQQ